MSGALSESFSSLLPTISEPELVLPEIDIRDYDHADYSYEVIKERIKEFEDELDNEHEVGVMLASFGQSITMTVTEIGYSNPCTLVFFGLVNGNSATLIQHMSQLNFLLVAVPKADPEQPPRRIGFALSEDEDSE